MSFIVKGIDIPKDGYIPMRIYANGHIWINGSYKGVAIQIPKDHGRIGDLDGVIKQIDESPTFASKYKGTARLFINTYSDKETILEPEE